MIVNSCYFFISHPILTKQLNENIRHQHLMIEFLFHGFIEVNPIENGLLCSGAFDSHKIILV